MSTTKYFLVDSFEAVKNFVFDYDQNSNFSQNLTLKVDNQDYYPIIGKILDNAPAQPPNFRYVLFRLNTLSKVVQLVDTRFAGFHTVLIMFNNQLLQYLYGGVSSQNPPTQESTAYYTMQSIAAQTQFRWRYSATKHSVFNNGSFTGLLMKPIRPDQQ